MKILFTSDIHDNTHWHDFLLQECETQQIDILLLGGDMLDGYKECGLLDQMVRFRRWIRKIQAKGIPMAFVCGNHDWNTEDIFPKESEKNPPKQKFEPFSEEDEISELIESTDWMQKLQHELTQIPYESRLYHKNERNIVVTTLKYNKQNYAFPKFHNETAIKEGLKLKNKNNAFWIIIHHEPPFANGFSTNFFANAQIEEWIKIYQPNLLACGHYHAGPDIQNTCFTHIGNTLVLNPGQNKSQEKPNRVLIDFTQNTATWFTKYEHQSTFSLTFIPSSSKTLDDH